MKLFYTKEEVIDGIQENIEALDEEKSRIDEALSSMDQLKLPLLGINFQEDYTLLKNDFDISEFTNKITQKYNGIKKKNEAIIARLESIVSGDASEQTKEKASQKVSSIKEHQDKINSIFKDLISSLGQDSLDVEVKREKAEEAASSFGVDISSISSSNKGLEVLIDYIREIIKDTQNYLDNAYVSIPASSISSAHRSYSYFSNELGLQIYALAGLYSLSKNDFAYLKYIYNSLEQSQYFINKIAFTLKKEKIEEAQRKGNFSIEDKTWGFSEKMTPYYEEEFLRENIISKIDKEIGAAQNKSFFEIKNNLGKYIKDIFEKAEICISKLSLEKIDGDGLLYQIKAKDYIDLFEKDFEIYCAKGYNFFSTSTLNDLIRDSKRMANAFKSRLSYPSIDGFTYTSMLSTFISDIPNSFYTEFCFSRKKILEYLNLDSADVYMANSSGFTSKAIEFFKEEKGMGELESLMYDENQDGIDIHGSSKQIPKKISLLVSEIVIHMSRENIQNIEEVELKDIGYIEKIQKLLLDVEKESQLLNLIVTRLVRIRGSLFKSNGVTSNFNILKEAKFPYFPQSRIDEITEKIEDSDADFALIKVFSGNTTDAHNLRSFLENFSEYYEESKCFIKISKDGSMEFVGFENLIRETIDLFIDQTRSELQRVESSKEILKEITADSESPSAFWEKAKSISQDFSRFGYLEYESNKVVSDIVKNIKKTFQEKYIHGSSYRLDRSLYLSNFKSNESISDKMISELSKSKTFGLDPVEAHKIKSSSFSKYKQNFAAYQIESKGQKKIVSPKFESMIISKILTNLSFGYSGKIDFFKNGSQNPVDSLNITAMFFGKEDVSVDIVKSSYSVFYDIFENHSNGYSFSEELKSFLKSAKKKQNSPRYTDLFLMLYKTEKPLSLISFVEILRTTINISVEKSISFAKKILNESDFSDAILYESINLLSLNDVGTNLIDLKSCLEKVDIDLGDFEKAFVISNVLKNIHNSHSSSNICEILYNIFSLDFLDGVHKSEAKSKMLDFASDLICFSFKSTDAFSRENFDKNLEKLKDVGFEFHESIEDDLSLVSQALVFSQDIFGDSENESVSSKENFYKIKAAMNNIKFLKSISNLNRRYLDIFSENKDVEKKEELFDLDFEAIPGKLRFRVLKKYDSYAMKVGADTNCCQVLGGAGQACVIDSLINPTASVLILEGKFEEGEALKSLSGKDLPEETVDGYRIISQSYFHFVDKETGVEVEGRDYIYNKYFVLDNIEASFPSMKDFKNIFGVNFDEAYKMLSSYVSDKGYNPIIVGKSFSPKIIKDNISGSSNDDNRLFAHSEKYTDFSNKDFVVLDDNLDNKMARYFGINRIYKNI